MDNNYIMGSAIPEFLTEWKCMGWHPKGQWDKFKYKILQTFLYNKDCYTPTVLLYKDLKLLQACLNLGDFFACFS